MNPKNILSDYVPDMLDEVTSHISKTHPQAAADWEATKIVAHLQEERVRKGLTAAEVAARTGLPTPRVNEIERRPWGVGFSRIVAYAQAIGAEIGVTVGDVAVP